jgi:hypothetical protein
MSGTAYPNAPSYTAALNASSNSSMISTKTGVDFKVLVDEIEALTQQAKSKIGSIRSKGSAMSIGDMFDLQMAMNKLQQFSEMSTSVISAMNTSINSMARNVKG